MHCESPTSDAPDAADDAAADVLPADDADAAIAYPAPHPAAPQILSVGGPVIASPRLVPIVFENDPLASTIGTFTKALKGSQYWKSTTSEYGVGDLAVDDLLVVPASDTVPGASLDDAAIEVFLAAHIDAPDANAIYMVFYPPGTTITKSGKTSCGAFGGYHRQVAVGSTHVAYAVIPRCATFGFLKGTDVVTAGASHELVEAATDPFETTTPAYLVPDDDHMAWAFYPESELGDMCSSENDSYVNADVGFTVQRTWSNLLAAKGGSPCAPVPADDVYYGAAPVFDEKVNMDLSSVGMGTVVTRGVTVKLGETKTIEVDVFSTAPTEPLKLYAFDYPAVQNQKSELELTFNHAAGVNGDKRQLTIKRVANDPTFAGTAFVVFTYTDYDHGHPSVGFVGQ